MKCEEWLAKGGIPPLPWTDQEILPIKPGKRTKNSAGRKGRYFWIFCLLLKMFSILFSPLFPLYWNLGYTTGVEIGWKLIYLVKNMYIFFQIQKSIVKNLYAWLHWMKGDQKFFACKNQFWLMAPNAIIENSKLFRQKLQFFSHSLLFSRMDANSLWAWTVSIILYYLLLGPVIFHPPLSFILWNTVKPPLLCYWRDWVKFALNGGSHCTREWKKS